MPTSTATIKVAVKPVVPIGATTQIGLTVTALLALLAALAAVLQGDHTPETLTALAGAVLTLLTVLGGRYAQAAAAIRGLTAGNSATTYEPYHEDYELPDPALDDPDHGSIHEPVTRSGHVHLDDPEATA